MEEGGNSKGWLIWLIVIPVCMAAGALLTKWALHPAGKAFPAQVRELAAPAPSPVPAAVSPAAAENTGFDLPGDEPAGAEAAVVWSKKPAAAAQPGAQPAAAPATDPKESRKDSALGFAYGALSKAAGKLLNNPKAVSALLNNDYVVKGFMSRDTVKAATASASSLSAYLKNPANMAQFMAKPAVQGGMNDQQLVNALASSKLAAALLDTPGGKELLNDPSAIGAIVQANPGLVGVLSSPAVLNALIQNPKTAGLVGQINMAGAGR